ncbi:MAG: quinolinate synthase NadA [Thermodesulfobacteriota bacterium]|nr:quinolinate synthase NadA [Thermodesulfobacteriota bacterium]
MTNHEAGERIRSIKARMGDRLVILGHHYQSDNIIGVSDYVGDSLELARLSSRIEKAQKIVFCGVYFMAETAAVLAAGKEVYIPDPMAGCPLAAMADIDEVERAWKKIMEINASVLPITYVNSSGEIKAFCGRNSGTVCTSGNAQRVFEWAFEKADTIFFMPDRNLGRNTARAMGIPDKEILLWDGTPGDDMIRNARVILWNGWCPVHCPQITADQIRELKREDPDIKVIVHPEADPEAVEAADASGSTSGILEYVKAMDIGQSVAVGTEYNMVARLADSYHALVQVVPVTKIYCEDMGRITLERLYACLSGFDDRFRVRVDETIARDVRVALKRMLEI